MIDQVAADKDIIVLRTFSKIYGMAGLRAGVAVARPDLLAKFTTVAAPARSLASISITSSAAARASLQDKELVPLRRKINADVRAETLEFLEKHNYKVLPGSQANFFMVDVKRPGRDFQAAMIKENIAIGRSWPAMPNYVRVTVGTKQEMAKFQTAFVKCMDTASGHGRMARRCTCRSITFLRSCIAANGLADRITRSSPGHAPGLLCCRERFARGDRMPDPRLSCYAVNLHSLWN